MTPDFAPHRPTRGREWVALALLVGAVTLPFVGKPYHLDDTFFLRVTEAVVANPLDPYGGELDWWDRPLPLFDIDSNPPGLSYYLAPIAAWTDFSELALHLAMIPFYALLAVSTWMLARRFTRHPGWVVAFTMTSAGVIVSGNVMRDIPAAALGVAAIAAAVNGTDRDDWRWWLLGGLLAGFAILVKYSALLLLPLLAAYPILAGRPRQVAWIGISLVVLGLWFLHNQWIYGEIHFINQLGRGYTSPGHGWQDNLCGLPVVAGSLLYLLPALVLRSLVTRDRQALGLGVVSVVATYGLVQWYMGGGGDVQYLFWAVTGGALLGWCVLAAVRGTAPVLQRRWDGAAGESLFLLLWLLAPLFLSVVFVPFQAVRHFLLALVPCVLLAFRYLEARVGGDERSQQWVLAGALALQFGVAIAVARADDELARTYRDFARGASQHVETVLEGDPDLDRVELWFLGHWGWMYYAEEEGLAKLHSTGPYPKAGDVVIIPAFVDKGKVLERVPRVKTRLQQFDQVVRPGTLPIRTMHPVGAGFYAMFSRPRHGRPPPVPYRFGGDGPLEIFDLHRMQGRPGSHEQITPLVDPN